MYNKLTGSLLLALAVAGAPQALAKGPASSVNEAATARHYASLIAGEPKLSELTPVPHRQRADEGAQAR